MDYKKVLRLHFVNHLSCREIAESCGDCSKTTVNEFLKRFRENPELLEEFLRTKRIPISRLAAGAGVEKKTLERHRKYMVALLLIYTNGYEIIRGHLKQVMKGAAKT